MQTSAVLGDRGRILATLFRLRSLGSIRRGRVRFMFICRLRLAPHLGRKVGGRFNRCSLRGIGRGRRGVSGHPSPHELADFARSAGLERLAKACEGIKL